MFTWPGNSRARGSRIRTETSCTSSRWAERLLALVLPVPRLPFRHPFDRLVQAPLPGACGLRLGDPFDVVAAVTGRKLLECRSRLLVLPQRGDEIVRRFKVFPHTPGP